jgi:hypothetical protein
MDVAARVRVAAREYQAMRADLEAGQPWPLAADFGTGPEASWGPLEVLAHVAEMLPYWLGQARLVMDGSGDPVPFGRTAEDPTRLSAVEHDRKLPVHELLERIDAAATRYQRELADVTDDALASVGVHPRLGEMSVEALFERFVTAHADDHIGQLRTLLRDRGLGGTG